MSTHLTDLQLDAILGSAQVALADSNHLQSCALCQRRLSDQAASEVDLLLLASTELFLDVQDAREHSEIRCISSKAGSSRSRWSSKIGAVYSKNLGFGRQLASSLAVVLAFGLLGWLNHGAAHAATPVFEHSAWLNAGCHASQPWCVYVRSSS